MPSKHPYSRKLFHLLFSSLLIGGFAFSGWRQVWAQTQPPSWPAEWQADGAFYNLWSRADAPVSMGAASRSWLWGPLPFAVANESYEQSSTGLRLVQYFDKARVEINDPAADRSSQWFVTSGLLVSEMVTGKVQTGDNRLESRQPAAIPVAGDPSSPDAPTYSAFGGHTAPDQDATGTSVTMRVGRDGALSSYSPPNDPALFNVAYYDAVTQHNVPAVFADWMTRSGAVLEDGQLVQERLIEPLFVLGHPITDAYWANVLVGGVPTTVLVQLFERRALTYNPNNPSDWRVEMANVGRAYYDWRYGSIAPDPAVAAEVGTDGLSVRGWNWPPSSTVSVQVGPPAGTPLAGPSSTSADASGRFSLQFAYTGPLQDALQSGASLQIKASSGSAQAALPLAGKPPSGSGQIEGTITFVQTRQAGTHLTMRALDGKQWSLVLAEGAAITSSEGSPLPLSTLDAGQSALAQVTTVQGGTSASSIVLLSESARGSRVSYAWSADGASIFVSGTGWPGEHDVIFSTGPAGGPQTQFGKLTSDSRGNLSGSIPAPAPPGRPSQWLFASSSDAGGLPAQVAVPLASLGSASAPPPIQLYITSKDGSQSAGVGSYCRQGKCAASAGASLPVDALAVTPGDLLNLRAQPGANPLIGQSASKLSIQLYLYPAGGGKFVPAGSPVFSTGDLPGNPFSLRLPGTLSPGRYAVVVTVTWPDTTGGKNDGAYAFALDVGGR